MAKKRAQKRRAIEDTPIPQFEFLDRAGEFLQAYHDLPHRTLFDWPKYAMLGHAAELMLKAYLVTATRTERGMSLNELSRPPFGHNLKGLLQAATRRGLTTDATMSQDIKVLSRAHNTYQARYPLVEIKKDGTMPEGPWAVAVEQLEPSVTRLLGIIRAPIVGVRP